MRESIKIKKFILLFYTFTNESWKICEANFTECSSDFLITTNQI